MYGKKSTPPTGACNKPLPQVTPLNEGFWELARRSVFSIQTCRACGHCHIPESPVCPRCLAEDQEWKPAAGTGTVESWVDFHRAYWDGFQPELPYRVVLVRLSEGPLFIARLKGEQAALKLGAPARVAFERVDDRFSLPYFELA